MAVQAIETGIERGIPSDPTQPFTKDLARRLKTVNKMIREQSAKVTALTKNPDQSYEAYVLGFMNAEKGHLLAEGVIFQANSENPQIFEMQFGKEGKKPRSAVHYSFKEGNGGQKPYQTMGRLQLLRLPGIIDSHEQALEYIESQQNSVPLQAVDASSTSGADNIHEQKPPIVNETVFVASPA